MLSNLILAGVSFGTNITLSMVRVVYAVVAAIYSSTAGILI